MPGNKNPNQSRRYLKFRCSARPINQANLLVASAAALVQILRSLILVETRRRHPQTRVLLEEIARAEHDAQRLGRHEREVLRAREVRDAELQPAHDVRVLDVVVAVSPVHDGLVVRPAGLAVRLADVVAGGEELVFAVLGDPERLAGEARTAPDETAGSAEQAWRFAADDLVAYGFLAGRVELVGVDDIPGAAGLVVVVTGALFACFQEGLLAMEGVAVKVACLSDWDVRAYCVILHDRVVWPVDGWVDAEREQMLVVVGVESLSDLGSVWCSLLTRGERHSVQDTGELDLKLVGSIQRERVVEAILVVGCGDDLRDDELAISCRHDGSITVVGVLVEKAIVLFVNADSVGKYRSKTASGRHDGIKILDGSLAVTACLQRVGHQTHAILANIECMLPVVRKIRIAVRDDHLGNTEAIEHHAASLLVHVVDRHIRDNDSFTVVKSDVHLVARPGKLVAVHGERDALGLGDIDGLEPVKDIAILQEFGKEVVRLSRHRHSLPVDSADIDTENFFLLGVDDHAEVKRMGVLVVVG